METETTEILDAAVILAGYAAKEKTFLFWSFGATEAPHSTPPEQLSVLVWAVPSLVSH